MNQMKNTIFRFLDRCFSGYYWNTNCKT